MIADRQASAELPLYWQILTLLFVLNPASDVKSQRQRDFVMLYSKGLQGRTPYLLSSVSNPFRVPCLLQAENDMAMAPCSLLWASAIVHDMNGHAALKACKQGMNDKKCYQHNIDNPVVASKRLQPGGSVLITVESKDSWGPLIEPSDMALQRIHCCRFKHFGRCHASAT